MSLTVPRVDSRLLADRLGISHKALINQIRNYKADFEDFGIMPFKNAKIHGKGRPQTITYLNEDQGEADYIGKTPYMLIPIYDLQEWETELRQKKLDMERNPPAKKKWS